MCEETMCNMWSCVLGFVAFRIMEILDFFLEISLKNHWNFSRLVCGNPVHLHLHYWSSHVRVPDKTPDRVVYTLHQKCKFEVIRNPIEKYMCDHQLIKSPRVTRGLLVFCPWENFLIPISVTLGQGHPATEAGQILLCPHNKVRTTQLLQNYKSYPSCHATTW